MASPSVSELRFGRYLAYSPRGVSSISRRSRAIRDAVKRGDRRLIADAVRRLAAEAATSGLGEVLGPDVTLVPAPRSGVLVEGGLWPPRLVAEELVRVGLGRDVLPCLLRVEPVPKSAFQAPGERPTVRRHYETMRVEERLLAPAKITIVDDFVTKGSTLLGGASRLVEAFPGASIAAFALVRTRGFDPEIEKVIDPCVGVVRLRGEDARRDP